MHILKLFTLYKAWIYDPGHYLGRIWTLLGLDRFLGLYLHVLKVSVTGSCALAEGHPPHIQSTASDGVAVRRVTLTCTGMLTN